MTSHGPRVLDPGLVIGAIAAAAIAACIGIAIPVALTGAPGYHGSLNPFGITFKVLAADITWTTGCTWIALGEVALTGLCAAKSLSRLITRTTPLGRLDAKASRLTHPREASKLTPAGVAEVARRIRTNLPATANPDEHGLYIATSIVGDVDLRQSFEDNACIIWGSRGGKGVYHVIPSVAAAPGPVLTTSRKPDVLDATRGVRSQGGRNAWVFDLMNIAGGPQTMWWNPLMKLDNVIDAARLGAHFTSADKSAATDAYFTPKIDNLVADLLLAAAVSGHIMTKAHLWSTQPGNTEPADLLEIHGYEQVAASVYGVIALSDRTRSGVYGGAESALSLLKEPSISAWVTPPDDDSIVQFDPDAFVSSMDALYLLSESGPGTPTPIIAAFVDSVIRAAEKRAKTLPSRRLDPPLCAVLDEICNIAYLSQLPNMVSFLAGIGVVINAYYQSYSQGERTFGRDGMAAIWSASNVRVIGSAVNDHSFLRGQSDLMGVSDESVRSVTHDHTGRLTANYSVAEKPIMRAADLSSLPIGRCVVLPSGSGAILARTRAWWDGPYAAAIAASLDRWDPKQSVPRSPADLADDVTDQEPTT